MDHAQAVEFLGVVDFPVLLVLGRWTIETEAVDKTEQPTALELAKRPLPSIALTPTKVEREVLILEFGLRDHQLYCPGELSLQELAEMHKNLEEADAKAGETAEFRAAYNVFEECLKEHLVTYYRFGDVLFSDEYGMYYDECPPCPNCHGEKVLPAEQREALATAIRAATQSPTHPSSKILRPISESVTGYLPCPDCGGRGRVMLLKDMVRQIYDTDAACGNSSWGNSTRYPFFLKSKCPEYVKVYKANRETNDEIRHYLSSNTENVDYRKRIDVGGMILTWVRQLGEMDSVVYTELSKTLTPDDRLEYSFMNEMEEEDEE